MYNLPKLNYEYNSLEPYIDTETMKTHYTKHHQTYVNSLNKIFTDSNIKEIPLIELLTEIDYNQIYTTEIKNQLINFGGGHLNHSLFWLFMSPNSSVNNLSNDFLNLINENFESLDNFMSKFSAEATKLFGSGWVWLVYCTKTRNLSVETSNNQRNPMMSNSCLIPLLCLDVWEHAYYLKYKNNRKGYITIWWKVVNWRFIDEVYCKCVKEGKHFNISNDGKFIN